MLYISTENIKYSTVGATFKVTFHTSIDEIGYLQAIHNKYAEMNMKAFPLTANTADALQTDYTPDCPFCVRYATDECLRDKCRHYQTYKTEPQTDCDHKCIQTEIGCERTDCAWR